MVDADIHMFGNPCVNASRWLSVQATCSGAEERVVQPQPLADRNRAGAPRPKRRNDQRGAVRSGNYQIVRAVDGDGIEKLVRAAKKGDAAGFTSVGKLQQIFVEVNVESDQAADLAEVNEDRALMRFEFLEVILRLAVLRREPVALAALKKRMKVLDLLTRILYQLKK